MKLRVIILAAGKGERLWPLTKFKPKPLLDLGDGTTILERQLNVLLSFEKVKEVLVVTGYLGNMIEEKIEELGLGNKVRTLYNPFYEQYNNLVSLWLALLEFSHVSSILITNGDNLFKHSLIQKLLEIPSDGIYLAVDIKENYDTDDMKVKIVNGNILSVSKEVPYYDINAESTGIALVKGKEYVSKFRKTADELIKNREFLNRYWLEIFNALSSKGERISPIFVKPYEWVEMDIHSDKELIQYLISKKNF